MARARRDPTPFDPKEFSYDKSTRGYVYNGRKPFSYKSVGRKRTVEIRRGDRIPERQYSNLRYESAGWQSKSQYETVRRYMHDTHPSDALKRRGFKHEAGAYNRWRDEYVKHTGKSLSSVSAVDSEFNQSFARALNSGFGVSPNGAFADFLSDIGLRDEGAEYDVGDTNPYQG